jgi:hypothetical protein
VNDDADTLAAGTDDDALIAEIKTRFKASQSYYDAGHIAALDDLQFLAGNHWPENVKREREIDGRPCLTINKLPTFLHQVTNDQRMNVPSIHVSPVDDHADVDTAETMQGIIRNIEYASNADIAYDTAVNNAAAIGFGYWRLVTDYCNAKSFDQDIRFRRIRNPFTVYFDPTSEEPDGSDAQFVIISSKIPKYEFKVQFPDADAGPEAGNGFPTQTGDGSNNQWLFSDSIRLAEYYRIEREDDTLVELSPGNAEFKSVLTEAGTLIPAGAKTRPTQRKKVMYYKCTAIAVLESTEIKCDWIPVFPVYGDELDIDGEIIRSGLIRNAKDPSKMYDYWMTSATEEVALRTKTPYIGAEGQFEGFEDDWNASGTRSFPYLEYKPVTIDGNIAPAPVRQAMADIPAGALQMAMHASDNIKATTGLFDSSLGALGSARSGVQERQQQRQGDTANFHFTDNLNRSVRQCGRCIVSMIPHYYDATRIVRILGIDGSMSHAKINQPMSVQKVADQTAKAAQQIAAGEQPDPIRTIENDMTVGEYDITIKAGPSYDTLRQEALDNMVELGGKWPKLMDVAGDLVVKSMDWPGAAEIAERLAKTLPPGLADQDDDSDAAPMVQTPKGPIPLDQAGQLIETLHGQVNDLGTQLQDAKSGIQKQQIASDSAVEVEKINAGNKMDVAELQGLIQLLIAKLSPPDPLAAAVAHDLGAHDMGLSATNAVQQAISPPMPPQDSSAMNGAGAPAPDDQQPAQPGQ